MNNNETVTTIILEAISNSADKAITIGDATFGYAEDTNEIVIVNKFGLIAKTAIAGIKELRVWLWDMIKKISGYIKEFFLKLLNLLAGNGFVLTSKSDDGTISVVESAIKKEVAKRI